MEHVTKKIKLDVSKILCEVCGNWCDPRYMSNHIRSVKHRGQQGGHLQEEVKPGVTLLECAAKGRLRTILIENINKLEDIPSFLNSIKDIVKEQINHFLDLNLNLTSNIVLSCI